MKKKKLKIIVAILSFKRSVLVQKAISSVLRQIDRTDLWIINNNESDTIDYQILHDICSKNELIILNTNNVSPGAARNIFLNKIEKVDFDFLLFLDDDDWLANNAFKNFTDFYTKQLSKNELISKNWFFSDPILSGKMERRFKKFTFYSPGLHLLSPLCSITSFVPSSMIKSGCRFNEDVSISEDWFFWLMAISKGFMGHYLSFPIFHYFRPNNNSRSSNANSIALREESISYFLETLKEGINSDNMLFKNELKNIENSFDDLNSNDDKSKSLFENNNIYNPRFWNENKANFNKLYKNYVLSGLTFVSDDWILNDKKEVVRILSKIELMANGHPYKLVASQRNNTNSIRILKTSDLNDGSVVYVERIMPSNKELLVFDVPNNLGLKSSGFRQLFQTKYIPQIKYELDKKIKFLDHRPQNIFNNPLFHIYGFFGPADINAFKHVPKILNLDIDFDQVQDRSFQRNNNNNRYCNIFTNKNLKNQKNKFSLHADENYVVNFFKNLLNVKPLLNANEIIFKIRTSSLKVLDFLPEAIKYNKIKILLIPNGNYFINDNFLKTILNKVENENITIYSNNFISEQIKSLNGKVNLRKIHEFID